MSEPQSNIDVGQLLHNDCDNTDEYDNGVEGALDIRRKFSLIVSQARRLKNEVLAKQAEIDRLNTRHQKEKLSHHQRAGKDLHKRVQAQGDRLQQNRETMRLLRRRNAQSAKDLEAARKELDQVDLLHCDMCKDTVKQVVTRCGHGDCKECPDGWLPDLYTARGQRSCPNCRQTLIDSEVRDVYLGSDTRTPAFLHGDETAEILTVDSDDE